jgi:uncharacterized protein YjbI with pentapeptide repeats
VVHLQCANLKGAHLLLAHLEGADLRGVTGLTKEQLAEAIIDDETLLPHDLQKNRTDKTTHQ